MDVPRKDTWTTEDDMVLAEVTLRHIREGSTQLAAFSEAGERLGRTPAACGFRWNSVVRKLFEEDIAAARNQRQSRKKSQISRREESEPREIQPKTVISMLLSLKETIQRKKVLEGELKIKEAAIREIKEENEKLRAVLASMNGISEDYKALLKIVETANNLLSNDNQSGDDATREPAATETVENAGK